MAAGDNFNGGLGVEFNIISASLLSPLVRGVTLASAHLRHTSFTSARFLSMAPFEAGW